MYNAVWKTAVIALGSNLDKPALNVQAALDELGMQQSITLKHISSFYTTTPVGYTKQPDFVNAVCMIDTDLSADELLTVLQNIELRFGRERSFRNAPRTLDLDIIDYQHEAYQSERLTLPHPRAHERSFVMIPLAEIAPDYLIGEHNTAAQLASGLGNEGVKIL